MIRSPLPRLLSCLVLATAVVACSSISDRVGGAASRDAPQTGSAATPGATQAAPLGAPVDDEAPNVAEIANRNIGPGECGMLLWTVTGGQPSLIFRYIEGGRAEMVIDGNTTRLDLTRVAGQRRYGTHAEQDFLARQGAAAGTSVRVTATFGIPFEGGTYVESGVITLANPQGWERVTPVAGLAGCRA